EATWFGSGRASGSRWFRSLSLMGPFPPPRFYCDYCDTYLTHDSPSVRKTHCSGRKHKENVKDYYQKWMEEQAQSLIDKTSKTNPFVIFVCFAFASHKAMPVGRDLDRKFSQAAEL
uniref:Small nuclear ribonucleoprotein polypeptide C n=1 Tax=Phasianus colchicus TaxID=9054 RepID=A0A669QHN0_PHACC